MAVQNETRVKLGGRRINEGPKTGGKTKGQKLFDFEPFLEIQLLEPAREYPDQGQQQQKEKGKHEVLLDKTCNWELVVKSCPRKGEVAAQGTTRNTSQLFRTCVCPLHLFTIYCWFLETAVFLICSSFLFFFSSFSFSIFLFFVRGQS